MASVDQHTLLDRGVLSPEQAEKVSKKRNGRPETAGLSAAIAVENARLGQPGRVMPRFPGEDSGRSLAEMARADLDAALQLLADRAQYITGAGGAAIALRRGKNNDMLCRASVGKNAPELGALLSTEYGLSGESVRTRQLLFCDDAERDQRVNRDLCRELGIASVAVMPILKEQQVLGIFEILSGKAKAFGERDLSALTRLAEMVATAVRHSGMEQEGSSPEETSPEPETLIKVAEVAAPEPKEDLPRAEPTDPVPVQESTPAKIETSIPAKKPLFWSAALQAQASTQITQSGGSVAIPPGLRNLKQCQACGFPISPGRTFCVECEEKRWRGRPAQPTVAASTEKPKVEAAQTQQAATVKDAASTARVEAPQPVVAKLAMAAAASAAGAVAHVRQDVSLSRDETPALIVSSPLEATPSKENVTPENPDGESSTFLSSALPSESWLSTHKYVLLALLIVAVIIAAIGYFH